MAVKKTEDALVDAGSEYSFPASDPPSYVGGILVTGAPARDGSPPREPVNHELVQSEEAKPAEDAQETDQARSGKAPSRPDIGGDNP